MWPYRAGCKIATTPLQNGIRPAKSTLDEETFAFRISTCKYKRHSRKQPPQKWLPWPESWVVSQSPDCSCQQSQKHGSHLERATLFSTFTLNSKAQAIFTFFHSQWGDISSPPFPPPILELMVLGSGWPQILPHTSLVLHKMSDLRWQELYSQQAWHHLTGGV